MTTFITVFIFTVAFAAAAEYAWWGPQRRIRLEIEQRLRGLRVEGGRRSGSLLRQQQLTSMSLMSRLELLRKFQALIDQARLPYRAGNVLTFSVLLMVTSYLAADILGLFPFLILKLFKLIE